MSVQQSSFSDKTDPVAMGEGIAEQAAALELAVREAVQQGHSLDTLERRVFDAVLRIGHAALELFFSQQGNGDLGESVTTSDGRTLDRSEQPAPREVRTVFGRHTFRSYVYAPGPHLKIELRPLEARMSLPTGLNSYLFEEFSQFFCVEQAFTMSRRGLETVLHQAVCVDQLQDINHRMGTQAHEFLQNLPLPPSGEEGELLVLTGDGKGVPLVKADAARVPLTTDAPERPGNRRMATLAGVYSVDCYYRTANDVLTALFRDPDRPKKNDRPKPCFKELIACFPQTCDVGEDQTEEVSGAIEAFTWAAGRIESRQRPGQTLVRLLDGAPSLVSTSDVCLPEGVTPVDILDIVHVAGYVKRAAKAFHSHEEHREAFSRDLLEKILSGQTASVIHGLRVRAGRHQLRGESLQEIQTVCGYFENNQYRMHYDEYLRQGYPIATGVIEGACRHLVKDRMERTGMRWRLQNAESMLHVRAVFQSPHWSEFHESRIATEQHEIHQHRSILNDYKPVTM